MYTVGPYSWFQLTIDYTYLGKFFIYCEHVQTVFLVIVPEQCIQLFIRHLHCVGCHT